MALSTGSDLIYFIPSVSQTTPTSNPIRAVVPQSCPYTYSGSINYAFGDTNDGGEGVLRYDLVRESSPGAGDGVLCGQLEVADTFDGWVAFGFSSTGQMIGSTDPANVAVIGRVDDKSVKKYTLPGRYVVEMAQEDQTLLDTNIAVVNDNIIMTFTKLLKEDGEVEIVVDRANEFISAKGQIISGNIANHGAGGRKDFILKDFSEDVVRLSRWVFVFVFVILLLIQNTPTFSQRVPRQGRPLERTQQ